MSEMWYGVGKIILKEGKIFRKQIIFLKNIVASKEKIKDLKIERLPVYFIS